MGTDGGDKGRKGGTGRKRTDAAGFHRHHRFIVSQRQCLTIE